MKRNGWNQPTGKNISRLTGAVHSTQNDSSKFGYRAVFFPKNIDWRKTVADHYGHLEKTFLQFAGIENVQREETFTTFSNGLDDELSALVKKNKNLT